MKNKLSNPIYIIMGKIFNYVLNSQIAAINSVLTIGEHFYVDWSYLPNTPYKVSFSFMSANQVSTNTTVANIYVDLGQGSTVIISPSNTNLISTSGSQAYRAGFLGNLEVRSYTNSASASGSYLFAASTTNPPIYLNSRPTNNDVFVEIHTNASTTETNYSPVPGQYSLILSLECQ
jgi:hypothetical protein